MLVYCSSTETRWRADVSCVYCVCVCVCVMYGSAQTRLFAVLLSWKSPQLLARPRNSYSSKDAYKVRTSLLSSAMAMVSNSCSGCIEHYGNNVGPRRAWESAVSTRTRLEKTMQIGSPSETQELRCGTESRSIPAQSKANNLFSFTEWRSCHAHADLHLHPVHSIKAMTIPWWAYCISWFSLLVLRVTKSLR